jgi:hypothetical protein
MSMPPEVRKFALTAHVVSSVGWLGASFAVLALAITGMASRDAQTVRAAYLAMDLSGWFVLVPLAFASLVTGIIQSLGTTWGLFRHYWVLTKLAMNVVATLILLLYTGVLAQLADIAAKPVWSETDLAQLRGPEGVGHAVAALLFLLVAVVLSVYKPHRMTSYGRRRQQERVAKGVAAAT